MSGFGMDGAGFDAEAVRISGRVKWVDAGSPKGDARDLPPAKVWPSEQGWNFAKQFGQKEPDLVIKSLPWTQKAGANDT